MPFTLSHPAFAAPLKKLVPSLSMTGLVLGSMAPDLEYFVAFETHRTIGHTYLGFLLMHIPLCIAFALAYHRLFKPTLPLLLPSIGRMDRLASPDPASRWELRTWRQLVRFLVSLFIGFLTHLFMDGLTHRHTFAYERIDLLREHMAGLRVYQWLQYGFSLLGAAIIALYLLDRWRRAYRERRGSAGVRRNDAPISGKASFRAVTFSVAAAVFAVKFAVAWDTSSLGFVLVAPFSAFMVGWLAAIWLRGANDPSRLGAACLKLAALGALAAAYQLATYGFDRFGYALLDWDSWQDYARARNGIWLLYLWSLSALLIVVSRSRGRNSRLRTGCDEQENVLP